MNQPDPANVPVQFDVNYEERRPGFQPAISPTPVETVYNSGAGHPQSSAGKPTQSQSPVHPATHLSQ